MYLITGGAGFIGSNIAAALADRGEDVAICDRMGQDERWRNLAKHSYCDIVRPEELKDWLSAHGASTIKAIVHMGAISATTEADVDALVKSNIRPSIDLWHWCSRGGVPFIYASSAATYGDGEAGFDDEFTSSALARLQPLNAYGWSKHFVDRQFHRCLANGEPRPPQWCGLKFFNVYGPNEYHKGSMQSVIAQNFSRVKANEPLNLFRSYNHNYKDGEQLRDFIYVQDCVDVVLWLLANPHISGLFNLGTGKARSWLDVANALFAAVNCKRHIKFVEMPESIREKYQYYTEARMNRLRDAGYVRPFHSLEEGIDDYVRNYLMKQNPYA